MYIRTYVCTCKSVSLRSLEQGSKRGSSMMDCSGHSHSPSSWSSCARFSVSSCNSSSCLVSICSFSASNSCTQHNAIQHNFNHRVPAHCLAITSVCIDSVSTQHNITQSIVPCTTITQSKHVRTYMFAHPYIRMYVLSKMLQLVTYSVFGFQCVNLLYRLVGHFFDLVAVVHLLETQLVLVLHLELLHSSLQLRHEGVL